MTPGAAYRVLLHAYPRAFRERFGAAMEQALRDRYRAAAARGRGAVAALAVKRRGRPRQRRPLRLSQRHDELIPRWTRRAGCSRATDLPRCSPLARSRASAPTPDLHHRERRAAEAARLREPDALSWSGAATPSSTASTTASRHSTSRLPQAASFAGLQATYGFVVARRSRRRRARIRSSSRP